MLGIHLLVQVVVQRILIALGNCVLDAFVCPQILERLQVFHRKVVIWAELVVDENLLHVFLYICNLSVKAHSDRGHCQRCDKQKETKRIVPRSLDFQRGC